MRGDSKFCGWLQPQTVAEMHWLNALQHHNTTRPGGCRKTQQPPLLLSFLNRIPARRHPSENRFHIFFSIILQSALVSAAIAPNPRTVSSARLPHFTLHCAHPVASLLSASFPSLPSFVGRSHALRRALVEFICGCFQSQTKSGRVQSNAQQPLLKIGGRWAGKGGKGGSCGVKRREEEESDGEEGTEKVEGTGRGARRSSGKGAAGRRTDRAPPASNTAYKARRAQRALRRLFRGETGGDG